MNLEQLSQRLSALAIFRTLLEEPVFAALRRYLDAPSIDGCAAFTAALYEANGGDLGQYVREACENSENLYVRIIGSGKPMPGYVEEALAKAKSVWASGR